MGYNGKSDKLQLNLKRYLPKWIRMVKQSIETAISVPPASHGPLTGSNEKQKINTIQGVKPNYFNAYTGIAFEYHLNKNIAVSLILIHLELLPELKLNY